jgi:hypothetical protein
VVAGEERVAHDHDIAASANRVDDGAGVLLPTGRVVVTRVSANVASAATLLGATVSM